MIKKRTVIFVSRAFKCLIFIIIFQNTLIIIINEIIGLSLGNQRLIRLIVVIKLHLGQIIVNFEVGVGIGVDIGVGVGVGSEVIFFELRRLERVLGSESFLLKVVLSLCV
ncbi:hypothetical protein PPERSA_08315 [Pseudocohnilembus persalinus]|uniref:Uncharacterized protein n=1 Tax=Pseudocohnilembus persalinus TaxID=266149 RepID=A0A0V0QPM3_PSEPJ|nr:hypothetical protein PPERSA_08315 [Pseudocohnilembus persalinus]|eukprot:KRX04100.1 hypothetical protein PPERSA_08315 [Pseudocohnilembus persalinus]